MTEDFRAEELIYMMKKIGLDLAAQIDCCLKNDEISGIQVYFLVYLLRHHSEGTYLTELCRETGMSKATLSALIKKLREKDYLYFREHPEDIRKKEVLPTKKLLEKREVFFDKARQMEDEVCGALSQEEKRIRRYQLNREIDDLKERIGEYYGLEEHQMEIYLEAE